MKAASRPLVPQPSICNCFALTRVFWLAQLFAKENATKAVALVRVPLFRTLGSSGVYTSIAASDVVIAITAVAVVVTAAAVIAAVARGEITLAATVADVPAALGVASCWVV